MQSFHLHQTKYLLMGVGPFLGFSHLLPFHLPSLKFNSTFLPSTCRSLIMGSRRLSAADEEAKIKEKHQGLLQEYLVLQKECVAKKRKLKETKERKETLLDEIRFLKCRRNFLLKTQPQNSGQQRATLQFTKTDAKCEAESSKRHATAQAFPSYRPPINPQNYGRGGKQEAAFRPLHIGKKPKDLLTNGKRAEKRKISWQDQLALKV